MRKRVVLGVVGAVICTTVAMLGLVALLNLTVFLEASVPPSDDLPEMPRGLRIVNETEGCGSGGCYREFDVEGGAGDTPQSILAKLASDEECSANSLVDRRRRCVGFRMGIDGVTGYVELRKWWD